MPRVAAVQLEASYLDPEAGMASIEDWARRAADDGAEIIVFPELLVPGYPRFVPDPFPPSEEGKREWEEAVAYHRRYVEGSQVVPGPFTDRLGEIAQAVGATLVVGVSERDPDVRGRLWNTGVVIDDKGRYLGKHRKLVGVMHERLIFDRGGAEDIRTFETPQANLGVCICFENLQPLYRRSLGRLGEEIHCALWTGPAPREQAAERKPLEQHEALAITHALDTGTFVVVASLMTSVEPEAGESGSRWSHSGGSYIVDPFGNTVAAVPDWEEGIAIADLDLGQIEEARLIWNHLGDDMRDDLFGGFPTAGAGGGTA
jgi:nitrilase